MSKLTKKPTGPVLSRVTKTLIAGTVLITGCGDDVEPLMTDAGVPIVDSGAPDTPPVADAGLDAPAPGLPPADAGSDAPAPGLPPADAGSDAPAPGLPPADAGPDGFVGI